MAACLEVEHEAGPLGVVLRQHVQVELAAAHGLSEGDPYPVHLGGLRGNAPVIAKGSGGTVCPYVLDRCGGDTQRLGETPRL